jgi:hypothetical protein
MPLRKKARAEERALAVVEDEVVHVLKAEAVQDSQRMGLVALWEAGELCDVTIECGGEEHAAHRVVIAASSAYFRAQFRSSMRDGGATISHITISDVPAGSFRAVLEHLYRGECRVTLSSLPSLLAAASRLEVGSLLRAGAGFLCAQLSPENAIATWLLADSLARPVELAEVSTQWLKPETSGDAVARTRDTRRDADARGP